MEWTLSLLALGLSAAFFAVAPGYVVLIAQRGRRWHFDVRGLATLSREVGVHVVFGLLKPLGWLPERLKDARGDARPTLPVVLVPGFAMNRSCWLFVAAALRSRGWRWVHPISNPNGRPVSVMAEALARKVEQVLAQTGAEQVDLVGHSMGGLVSAWALQQHLDPAKVRRLVTLGTPWEGTPMAVFRGPFVEGDDLLPEAAIVRQVGEPQVPVTSIWSPSDHLVIPSESALPDWIHVAPHRAVRIPQQGHLEMLASARVIAALVHALDRAHEGGEE